MISERQFLEADRAAVSSLLAGQEPDSFNTFWMEDRLAEIAERLASLAPTPTTARFALTFEGPPVVGSVGIDPRFAGAVVADFDSMVAGATSLRDPKGLRHGRLAITGVATGSFGFSVEETFEALPAQADFFKTSLAEGLADVVALIRAAIAPGDDFTDVASDVDSGVYSALQRFMDTLRKGGATAKLTAGSEPLSVGPRELAIATEHLVQERAETEVTTGVAEFRILPNIGLFEARDLATGAILKGKIAPVVDRVKADELRDRRCDATLRVVKWVSAGRTYTRRTLLAVTGRE
jgi:hypothetical protein